MKIKKIWSIFKYNTYITPVCDLTIAEAQEQLRVPFPEIANAKAEDQPLTIAKAIKEYPTAFSSITEEEQTKLPKEIMIVTFKKVSGTKS